MKNLIVNQSESRKGYRIYNEAQILPINRDYYQQKSSGLTNKNKSDPSYSQYKWAFYRYTNTVRQVEHNSFTNDYEKIQNYIMSMKQLKEAWLVFQKVVYEHQDSIWVQDSKLKIKEISNTFSKYRLKCLDISKKIQEKETDRELELEQILRDASYLITSKN